MGASGVLRLRLLNTELMILVDHLHAEIPVFTHMQHQLNKYKEAKLVSLKSVNDNVDDAA